MTKQERDSLLKEAQRKKASFNPLKDVIAKSLMLVDHNEILSILDALDRAEKREEILREALISVRVADIPEDKDELMLLRYIVPLKLKAQEALKRCEEIK